MSMWSGWKGEVRGLCREIKKGYFVLWYIFKIFDLLLKFILFFNMENLLSSFIGYKGVDN